MTTITAKPRADLFLPSGRVLRFTAAANGSTDARPLTGPAELTPEEERYRAQVAAMPPLRVTLILGRPEAALLLRSVDRAANFCEAVGEEHHAAILQAIAATIIDSPALPGPRAQQQALPLD